MRLVQYLDPQGPRVVAKVADAKTLVPLTGTDSVYALAHRAVAEGTTIAALAEEFARGAPISYADVVADGRLLTPLDHPVDEARCWVTGTGLTHLGTGEAAERHLARARKGDIDAHAEPVLALLTSGALHGKPANDGIGPQPEWFYKGDGQVLLASGQSVEIPSYARGAGDETEIAALYVVDGAGVPCRVGYALANEITDHRMNADNLLYGAHAKLRQCALGPELLLGELPERVSGETRIVRNDAPAWRASFETGASVLTHSLANLEHHHFKYPAHRRAGDVHVHCLGAAVTSASDEFEPAPGDRFEIECAAFGRALVNPLTAASPVSFQVRQL